MELELGTFDLPAGARERAHAGARAGRPPRDRARRSTSTDGARRLVGRRAQGQAGPAQSALQRRQVHAGRRPRDVRARVADANGDAVEIAVTDTGVGIAPDDQDAIFEEFRQAAGAHLHASGRHGPRAGAGKALRRAARRDDPGRERAGRGSTFAFLLPRPRQPSKSGEDYRRRTPALRHGD